MCSGRHPPRSPPPLLRRRGPLGSRRTLDGGRAPCAVELRARPARVRTRRWVRPGTGRLPTARDGTPVDGGRTAGARCAPWIRQCDDGVFLWCGVASLLRPSPTHAQRWCTARPTTGRAPRGQPRRWASRVTRHSARGGAPNALGRSPGISDPASRRQTHRSGLGRRATRPSADPHLASPGPPHHGPGDFLLR